MKKIITLLILMRLISTAMFAQSWTLFNENMVYHYAQSDTLYPEYSVRIDSVDIQNGDSVFYFNKIVIPCQHCRERHVAIVNSPNLFDYKCSKSDSGYWFMPMGNTLIKTVFPKDSVWVYDSANNISAKFISATKGVTFGKLDSLKTIVLSTKDTIVLSKKFGLIKYTNPFDSKTYQLNGVKHGNTKIGKVPPDFSSIYDFDVGDMFYYNESEYCYCEVTPTTRSSIYKIEILDKWVNGDTIKYFQKETGFKFSLDFGIPYRDTSYYSKEYEMIYVDSLKHFANLLVNEPVCLEFLDDEFRNTYGYITFEYDLYYKRFDKSYGVEWYDIPNKPIFCTSSDEDVFDLDYPFEVINCGGDVMFSLEEGAGLRKYSYMIFEFGYGKELVGYIKNGVEFGTVYSDGYLTSKEEHFNGKFNMYPNPARDIIYFETTFPGLINLDVTIVNVHGQIVMQYNSNQSNFNLDVSGLKSGVYIARVYNNNLIIANKLFIRKLMNSNYPL